MMTFLVIPGHNRSDSSLERRKRNARSNLWPFGIIPYEISDSYNGTLGIIEEPVLWFWANQGLVLSRACRPLYSKHLPISFTQHERGEWFLWPWSNGKAPPAFVFVPGRTRTKVAFTYFVEKGESSLLLAITEQYLRVTNTCIAS